MFTFIQDPPKEGSRYEPHTRIFHEGRECGIIVHDETDDVYDIWIAVRKREKVPEGVIEWKWIEFTTRPPLLRQAQAVAEKNFASITAKYQLHLFQ